MLKYILAAFLTIICSGSSLAQNYAFVLNGLAETLSRINLETGRVDNHIVTLGAVPNQVIYHDNSLYVVNSSSASLMVIDPITNGITDEFALPTNSNPWNVDVAEGYAYVTGLAANAVYKVDLSEGLIVDTWETGLSPEGVLASANRVYVSNTAFNPVDFSYGQGSVSIYDLGSGDELSRVDVGKNPQNLIIGPDGMLNVICTGDYASFWGIVYFIDPAEMSVVDSLTIGGTPTIPVINSSGIAYVAAGGWSDNGYIYSYNCQTRTVIRGSDNPITVSKGAMGLALDSLGMIYCACQMDNVVDQLSPDGTIENSYNMGSGPSSIAIVDSRTGIEENDIIPAAVSLGSPYPNPFNNNVKIPIGGVTENNTFLEIYDITGRLVKKLSLPDRESIYNSVTWNGTGAYGQEVASGVYFVRLSGTTGMVKMVLLQ